MQKLTFSVKSSRRIFCKHKDVQYACSRVLPLLSSAAALTVCNTS